MSRIYEEFCELMSAYNEANDKWTPIQKAHELLGSVNEDEIWEQRNAAANALYKYIAELTTRIAKLEAKNNRLVELAEGLADMVDWSGCDCDKPFILTEWEEFIAEVQE